MALTPTICQIFCQIFEEPVSVKFPLVEILHYTALYMVDLTDIKKTFY